MRSNSLYKFHVSNDKISETEFSYCLQFVLVLCNIPNPGYTEVEISNKSVSMHAAVIFKKIIEVG